MQTAVAEYLNTTRTVAHDAAENLQTMFDRIGIRHVLEKLATLAVPVPQVHATVHAAPNAQPATRQALERVARHVASTDLAGTRTEPEQRILNSLAWWESAGVTQPMREQVAFVARYSVNGHFNNNLGAMRTNSLIEYPAGNRVCLTSAGRGQAQAPESQPDREELIGRCRVVLREEPQRRIFDVLVAAPERELCREDLAARTRYTVNGHFNNTLGRLRTLGLIRYPRGNYVALSELFDALS